LFVVNRPQRIPQRRVALLLFVCPWACTSARTPIEPLVARSEWSVRYAASASSEAWTSERPPSEEGGDGALEPLAPQVLLECRAVRAPTSWIRAWTQDDRAVYGMDVPRGSVEAMLGAPDVEVLTAPRIVLSSGSSGTIEVSNQRAFVESFDVVGDGAALIADPVVSVARDGMHFLFRATLDGEAVDLEFTAELAHIQQLERARAVQLPVGAPVHIQQPVTVLQRVETAGSLAGGRQLVVCTPSAERGNSYLLLVTAEEVAARGDGRDPSSAAPPRDR